MRQLHYLSIKQVFSLILLTVLLLFAVSTNAVDYYSKSTGNLNATATWGTNTNGSGTSPSNFTTAGNVFYIRNNSAPTINGSWTVSGSGSKIVVGDGTNACNFTVGSNYVLTATVDVSESGTLTLSTSGALTGINFGTLSDNSTVNYARAGSQTCRVATYSNLTISGSGTKTFATSPTVNRLLSMEGTAAITVTSGVVTYGADATLQYNTSTARTASSEEWISPFAATGGVVISGTGIITANANKVFNTSIPLTVNTGATLSTSTRTFTLGGDIINSGIISGTGAFTITGNVDQNIGSFSTTSTVSMTKTGGTATFTGNVGGGAFTLNGSGGTLDLGSGLTHTFSGTWTRTNGTLNGGSSRLRIGGSVSGSGGTFNAGTGTVEWYGSTQTAAVVTYNNLIVSGTLVKTFATSPTVNGILSMEGTTASITVTTGVVSYGQDAKLQYNKTAAYTATTEEWPATFSGSGGVNIINTGVITFGAAKEIANNLSIGTGSSVNLGTFNTHTAGSLTLGGNTQSCGTWGYGPGTPPANKNQTFFANTSGYIMVGTIPAVPTSVIPSVDIEICSGDGTYINATSAGNTINWYTTPTGGTSIGSSVSGADFYVSPVVNTTYYAETQNAGGCVSATRTATATISLNTQITKNYLDIQNSTHTTVCATAAENNNVVISAPAGNFFVGVDFASYGTPNGSCESYTLGSCHAATSISVCESYLLGNSNATIPATNGVFTDPCVGTVKRLYVQAVYNSTQFEICEGSSPGTITGSVPSGGNGTYTYLWESSTTNSSSGFVPADGINNVKDYTPAALTQTTWFRRTVTSGGCSSTSFAVEITVNPAIAIFNPGAQIACDSYTLPAITGTNLSGNQKYYNNSQALGGSVITGPVTTTQTVWIYDTDGICSDEESFVVTIIGKPLIDPISAVSTLCAGGTVNPANPAVTANGSSVTSQGWQIETTAGGGIFGSLTLPYTVFYTDNGKKVRFYATNSCGTAYSNEVPLSVTPLPTITNQPSPLTLCEGESGNFTVVTTSPSPSYQWQYSTTSTGPWTNTDGAAGVTGHTTDQLSITTIPSGYNNFYVSCIITSNSCSIQTTSVLITVNPVPVTGEIIPD